MNIFNQDNIVFSTINKLTDLVFLNILWFIFSIPIFTIGASTTALYYVTGKMAAGQEGYIAKSFFTEFKKHFKFSLKIWIPTIILAIVLWVDLYFWRTMTGNLALIMTAITFTITYLLGIVFIYLMCLIPYRQDLNKNILKCGAILTIKYLPRSFLMLVIAVGLTLLASVWLLGIAIYLLIGVSLIAFLQSFFINQIFRKEKLIEEDQD